MNPNHDITDQLLEIFKPGTPRGPASDPDPYGSSAREVMIPVQMDIMPPSLLSAWRYFFMGRCDR
jgi:hypothetical protein